MTTKDDLVLPRRINASNPDTFGRTAEEHSSDTYQTLLKVRDRLSGLRLELDALEKTVGGIVTFPGLGAPSQGIGGGNLPGVSPLAARADHDHTIRETSGPTDLSVGNILALESIRRVGDVLVGRQIEVARLATTASTSSTAAVDVSSDLSFDLKAATNNLIAFVLYYDTAAVTTGCRFALNYSGSLVPIGYALLSATSLTAMQCEHTAVIDTLLGQAGVGPGNTTRLALVLAMIRTATAGNLILRFASGVAASSVTVRATSHGLHVQL